MVGNNLLAERDLTFVVEMETINMVNKGRALGARAAVYCAVSKWTLAIEDCQRARVLDPQGSERYKIIQQSARDAAEKAEREAKDNAEQMMQQLIQEEAIEKQRSVDAREKKKKKKQKQKKKGSSASATRTSSFDLLRNMASISSDSAELNDCGTFDNDDNEILGLIDCSDGESDNDAVLELERPVHSTSSSALIDLDEQVVCVERTLFDIEISDEVRAANTPIEKSTPQKMSPIAVEQVPKSKLASFTPSTPKKIKSDEQLSQIYESRMKSETKVTVTETPKAGSSSSTKQDGSTEKSSISLVDMLMFFLPTFPMFNVSEQQQNPASPRKVRDSTSQQFLSIEEAEMMGTNIIPNFKSEGQLEDTEEDYGNYLEIMSDSELSSIQGSDEVESRVSASPVSLKRETSADSDGFRSALSGRARIPHSSNNNLAKIASLNSLSKAATRSRSNSFTQLTAVGSVGTSTSSDTAKVTPPPTLDDVVSAGKLAFSKAHVIGRGSFGTMVYAGAHAEFGRAAIKAISKEGEVQNIQ
jgi:hypothetical protein